MHFHIRTEGRPVDLDLLRHAVAALDPAAVLDLDPAGPWLRVGTVLGEGELAGVLSRAGWVVRREQVLRQRSECCGGCGG